MSDWLAVNSILFETTLTTLLLALSIQVPIRFGVFSFAGVAAFGIGGYGAAMGMLHAGWNTPMSIAVAAAVAGVVTYLFGLVVKKLTGLYMGMASIAFALIISVLAVNGGELTGGASGLFGALGVLTIWDLVLITAVVVIGLHWTETGAMGRRIDAVREDPELANSLGINVVRYRQLSFLISGVIGGLAGGLTTLLRSTITPSEVNFHLVVIALTAIVVGGSGSWIGALIGAVMFVWLPTGLTFIDEWEQVVYGLIVAIAAVYLPSGVLGLLNTVWHRYRTRDAREQVTTNTAEAEV